ncbi:MAG: hypothetical protein IJL74_04175 [Bacilli bacterium]|nr:hypothetical protein [Bacilli bacterium]
MTKESKKIVAGATALVLMAGGAVYGMQFSEKSADIKEKHQKVLEIFNEDTKLDEAIEENMATYNDKSIIEEADYLEESIDIVEMLNYCDFSEVKDLEKLSDEEYAFAATLAKEDVIILLQVVQADKDSLEFQESKLKAIKMLDYVKTEREKYISKHGKKVVLKLLSWTIKGSMAEELDLETDEISNIEIPSLKKVRDLDFYVIYDGQKYYPAKTSNTFDPLYYYYQIDSTNNFNEQEYEIYKEALSSGKVLTMTGIKQKGRKLVNVRSLKEAKKELKQD